MIDGMIAGHVDGLMLNGKLVLKVPK